MVAPYPQQRLDLALDLQVEEEKLDRLVASHAAVDPVGVDGLRVDAAAPRHLYSYDLQPERLERLRILPFSLWPQVRGELVGFQRWLRL